MNFSPSYMNISPQEVVVSGGLNKTVTAIINGTYVPQGMNHGKPVFRKDANVLIYYWDMRDGDTFCGWWFGPKVGGNQVWAHSAATDGSRPPGNGWKVPWDGAVDATFKITCNYVKSEPKEMPQQRNQSRPFMGVAQPPLNGVKQTKEEESTEKREKERQQALKELEEKKLQEEERKKRDEVARQEEMKRRAEAFKKKQEEALRYAEQAAALAVRKVIQRVRIATPENFDELLAELEKVQVDHLNKLGSQAEKIQNEAESALNHALKRVAEMGEKQVVEEQRRREEETQRKLEAKRLERLAAEISKEITEVERLTACASDVGKPLFRSGSDEVPEPQVELEAVRMTEVALEPAQAVLQAASKSLEENADINAGDLETLWARLGACRHTLQQLREKAKTAQERASRKAAAIKRENDHREQFMKHDCDGDGELNREEAAAFAVAEYEFTPSEEMLDKMFMSLASKSAHGGIPLEKAQRLRSMIAIAQSEVKARAKRLAEKEKDREKLEEEAAKKRVVAEKTNQIEEVLNGAVAILKEVELIVTESEGHATPLSAGVSTEQSVEELKKKTTEIAGKLSDGFATLGRASEKLAEATSIARSTDGFNGYQKDIMKFRARVSRLKLQLDRMSSSNKATIERWTQRSCAEMDELCTKIATGIQEFINDEGKSAEQLFVELSEEFSEDEPAGHVSMNAFVTCVRSLPGLEDVNVEKVFSEVTGGASRLGLRDFLDFIRIFYKVVKPTVLTETISIKSITLRRLNVGEVVEVLEGPKTDDAVGLMRFRVQAVQDCAHGWVTITGNHGTAFIEPGGKLYICVKETDIMDHLPSERGKVIRRLARGETVKVLEFESRSLFSQCLHMKCKANLDGTVGWVIVKELPGTTFLELCWSDKS